MFCRSRATSGFHKLNVYFEHASKNNHSALEINQTYLPTQEKIVVGAFFHSQYLQHLFS